MQAQRKSFAKRNAGGEISPPAGGDQRSTPLDPFRLLKKAGENFQAIGKYRKHTGSGFHLTRLFLRMYYFFSLRYLSIAAAAVFPAPIAEITVAAPVTASPPAKPAPASTGRQIALPMAPSSCGRMRRLRYEQAGRDQRCPRESADFSCNFLFFCYHRNNRIAGGIPCTLYFY